MPTSPFLNPAEWTIRSWVTGSPVPEGIPEGGFQTESTMRIELDPPPAIDSYSLHWLDQAGQACSVSGLHPDPQSDPEASTLKGHNLIASFGTTKQVPCDFSLHLKEPNKLDGSISLAMELKKKREAGDLSPDAGSGTFTAEANPSPPIPDETGAASKRRPR